MNVLLPWMSSAYLPSPNFPRTAECCGMNCTPQWMRMTSLFQLGKQRRRRMACDLHCKFIASTFNRVLVTPRQVPGFPLQSRRPSLSLSLSSSDELLLRKQASVWERPLPAESSALPAPAPPALQPTQDLLLLVTYLPPTPSIPPVSPSSPLALKHAQV